MAFPKVHALRISQDETSKERNVESAQAWICPSGKELSFVKSAVDDGEDLDSTPSPTDFIPESSHCLSRIRFPHLPKPTTIGKSTTTRMGRSNLTDHSLAIPFIVFVICRLDAQLLRWWEWDVGLLKVKAVGSKLGIHAFWGVG